MLLLPSLEQLLEIFPGALLVEPAASGSLPGYDGRRELRSVVEAGRRGTDCLIFADPAHSAFVVGWRAKPSSVLLEFRLPGGELGLAGALADERLARAPEASRRTRRRGGGRGAAGGRLGGRSFGLDIPFVRAGEDPRGRLLEVVGRRIGVQGRGTLDSLCGRIGETQDAGELRRVWAALDALRLLDASHDAGGQWLLRAATTLEPVYLALTCRTRIFIADVLAAGRHRPEYLKDLRFRIDAADAASRAGGQTSALRRGLVRQNLFAMRRSSGAAGQLRRLLCDYAGLPTGATSLLDCNVSWIPEVGSTCPQPACRPSDGSCGAEAGRAEPDRGGRILAGEVDESGRREHAESGSVQMLTLRLAWQIVRGRRGADLQNDLDDGVAAVRLERRRRRWVREHCGESLSAGARVTPLTAAAAFPWLDQHHFQLANVAGRLG